MDFKLGDFDLEGCRIEIEEREKDLKLEDYVVLLYYLFYMYVYFFSNLLGSYFLRNVSNFLYLIGLVSFFYLEGRKIIYF